MEERKFSVLAYAAEQQEEQAGGRLRHSDNDRSEREREFRRLVDDVRSELVAPRGVTEEARRQFGDTLNRAVLGFEEDRAKLLILIEDILAKKRTHGTPPPGLRYATLAEALFAEVIGLNVLELILKNREGLEEIQVIGTKIFEVRDGTACASAYEMQSVRDLERIQQNLVLFNSDRLSPRKRWAEVMLRDGSRVTMTGFGFTAEPTLTIRFFTVRRFDLDTLCGQDYATMSERMRDLLRCLLRARFNLVIIGPTNTGKTNLMKACIAELPDEERIVTIESRLELRLRRDFPGKNVIEYEVNEDDRLHAGDQAFKLALRQSPKRIVHAEIRDEDANLYVRACTRGHDGSMTTVHVSALEDAPEAIADMCMLDGRGMSPDRLVKRIAAYVTQVGLEMALVDGKRKLVRIGEYELSDGEVRVRDIAKYDSSAEKWMYPDTFSRRAAERFSRFDPDSCDSLREAGWLPCC